MSKEKVSIVLPTYNREHLLKDAVESIQKQTYLCWELIIVDDGSTDNTLHVVNQLQEQDSRIFYYKTPGNRGACAARNLGVEKATGSYIAFQDSDDVWLEHKLEKQLAFLKEQEADVVFCPILVQKKENEPAQIFPDNEKEGEQTYEHLLLRSIGSTQTFFGKKECFLACPFDEQMPRMQDWDVLLQLAQRYQISYQQTAMALVRVQDDSLTKKTDLGLIAYEKIYSKHKSTIEGNSLIKGFHVLLKGHLLYLNGNNPTGFYKENLKMDTDKKIKFKILVKYVLGKIHLLSWFYKKKR